MPSVIPRVNSGADTVFAPGASRTSAPGVVQLSSTVMPTRSSDPAGFPFSSARGPDHGPGKEHDQHQQDLAPSLAHEPPNTFPLRAGRTRLRRPASLPDRPIRIHTLPIHPTRTRRRASGPERRSDPQSVIGRTSASLHPNPENPARSTWSTQSDWSTLQSVCHACLDDAELGSIAVETFDTA